jgi:alkaline phosphatase D
MLGSAQERWLFTELQKSQAQWKVIAQQTLMAPIDQGVGEASKWWSDGWDGYPAARNRLLTHLSNNKLKNTIVIGGDVHSFWVNDLMLENGPTIATEFVGSSITSAGIPYERIAPILPKNPHVKFFESRERGYVRVEVMHDVWKTDLRAMSTVASPIAEARTLKSFIVESGQAGAVPVGA